TDNDYGKTMGDRPASIFSEIERELLDSEIYQLLSTKLEQTWGGGVEKLLRIFSQEVIQLTKKYWENLGNLQPIINISPSEFLDAELLNSEVTEDQSITPDTSDIDEIAQLREMIKEGSPKHSLRDIVNSSDPEERLRTIMTINQISHDPDCVEVNTNNRTKKPLNTIPLPELKIAPDEKPLIHVLPDGMGMTVEVGEHLKEPGKPRLSYAEKMNLALAEQRQEFLEKIAQEFRQARLNHGLSLEELNSKTFVPLHHIASIENQEWQKLPEDIYVKGFIQRLGDALGFDGKVLANNLPMPDNGLHIPSLVAEDDQLDFNLHPLHLYVGYAALMAGAVGGMSWLSQQSQPSAQIPTIPNIPSQITPSQRQSEVRKSPQYQKSLHHQMKNLRLAPPEMI
ncbi:MAG: helix-turn-helix domain-containing protein, partial [Microcoleaceae cyanobacterium]